MLDQTLHAKLGAHVPDPAAAATKYRYWQVESLLNQCADAVEKVVVGLADAAALGVAHTQLLLENAATERDLLLDEERLARGDYARAAQVSTDKLAHLASTQELYQASLHATGLVLGKALVEYPPTGPGDIEITGRYEYWRARHGEQEKQLDRFARDDLRASAQRDLRWGNLDAEHSAKSLASRRQALVDRRAAMASGEALAYSERRDRALRRIEQNWHSACGRAEIVARGMKTVLGYDFGGDWRTPGTIEERATALFVEVRRAIDWLVAYGHGDHEFCRAIPLAALVNGRPWKKGQSKVTFVLNRETFLDHDNVRLRGVAAMTVGTTQRVPWLVQLAPPRHAVYERGGVRVAVDQSLLPECVLGRVLDIDASRPAETGGMISLMNASPVGEGLGFESSWTAEIVPPHGVALNSLDDLVVEFIVAGRSRRRSIG